MTKTILRNAWMEVNLNSIDHNIKAIKNLVGDTKIVGVIKANGYGHGDLEIAKVLQANDVDTFAVASITEGLHLRENNIKEDVILLGINLPETYETIIKNNLIASVDTLETAKGISQVAQELNMTAKIILAIDTGMTRIGFAARNKATVTDIQSILALPNVEVYGMFSHFATADATDKTHANIQHDNFKYLINKLEEAGCNIPIKMIANSAAIMDMADTYYDAVRPGIILYGYYPSDEVNKSRLTLKSAMQIKAKLLNVKTIPADTGIGYGRKFVSDREMLVGTIGIGYADGLSRTYSASGQAYVLINGKKAPILGNICMDQCMLDLTNIPTAKVGDEVVIMGTSVDENGNEAVISTEYIAGTSTIGYEVLCRFDLRLEKIYTSLQNA